MANQILGDPQGQGVDECRVILGCCIEDNLNITEGVDSKKGGGRKGAGGGRQRGGKWERRNL